MYKLRLSKSIGFLKEGFYDAIKSAKEDGLEAVDFDICGKWTLNAKDPECHQWLTSGLEAVKASGLPINGVHIPFGRTWDFSDTCEEIRAEAVASFKSIVPLIDSYNPHCYVIHGSYEPIEAEDRVAKIAALKKSLREILEATKTTIAVEILPRTCLCNTAAEAIEIIDSVNAEMNTDQIRICVDVNHFLQESSEDGVLALGSRIVTTHISDHDYINERHWLPGEGKINWMALIAAFERIGYDGAFNYECGTSVPEVKENYDKLFGEYNK